MVIHDSTPLIIDTYGLSLIIDARLGHDLNNRWLNPLGCMMNGLGAIMISSVRNSKDENISEKP